MATAPDPASTTSRRRSFVKGVAWAAPTAAIAVTAPALAASSPCAVQAYTTPMTTTRYSRTPSNVLRSASGTAVPANTAGGATNVTYAVTSTSIGVAPPFNENLTLVAASTLASGQSGNVIRLYHQAGREAGQLVTFTFSRPIQDLTMTLLDVDSGGTATGFRDHVSVSPAPAAETIRFTNSSYLEGSGTAASRFRPRSGVATSEPTSSNGNVTFRIAGPTTTVALTYVNGNSNVNTAVAQQGIGVALQGLVASGCS